MPEKGGQHKDNEREDVHNVVPVYIITFTSGLRGQWGGD